jgi:KDO2-lipid IV(A) lauroyltransferase
MTAAGRWKWRFARRVKWVSDAIAGRLAVWLLRAVRRSDPDRFAELAASLMRRAGPFLPEHRVGRANLRAAYPDKAPAEIEAILGEVWAGLGRLGAEYAHLDRLWDFDAAHPQECRVEVSEETIERFIHLRDDGRPALIFAAHLANWELPALAAAAYGLETAILYRAPNLGDVASALQQIRAPNMGTLIASAPDASLRLAAALERGGHVGMLVDQHHSRGVDVEFFGRPCKANPLLARLARHFDCPIHGTRVVRLPRHRFRVELTDAVAPARDPRGDVDIQATMQRITAVVETWVREHPEQWLWLHRRWR